MAAPNPVDGAAARLPADADLDEPMDVDPHYLSMMKVVLFHSGTNIEDLLRTAGRKPGEDPTMGDLQNLGLQFRDRMILSHEASLNARQIDADDDATRRRGEMAADADFSEEHHELFNELYPLESCVPADNKHMGKQISTLAAKMIEKKRFGGLAMDSPADWIRTRQELEETFRDARLSSNQMAIAIH